MPWIIAATTAIFCRIVQFLYYSDVDQIMLKSLLVSVFFEKKTLQKYVDMFLACPKSKVTIKLKFYYSNLKNAVETAKIAVDSCYVLRQFLTSLPLIDFREIRGLSCNAPQSALLIFLLVLRQTILLVNEEALQLMD